MVLSFSTSVFSSVFATLFSSAVALTGSLSAAGAVDP